MSDTNTKNAIIVFDKEESGIRSGSGMDWFYGTVRVGGKEFDFSLCEMNDKNSGSSSTEITWIDATPNDSEKIEDEIVAEFNNTFEGE